VLQEVERYFGSKAEIQVIGDQLGGMLSGSSIDGRKSDCFLNPDTSHKVLVFIDPPESFDISRTQPFNLILSARGIL
jgi:hypothetical protein